MRSWVLSIIGISSLAGALTAPAIGQGGATAPPQTKTAAPEQKAFKEQKFKLEWTVKSLNASAANTAPDSESIVITSADGQTTMTTNPLPSDDKYRRVALHSDLQPDGSYLVNVNVSEFTKDMEREIPRIDTVVKVRTAETKIIQDRISKGSNYTYQYQFTITPVIE